MYNDDLALVASSPEELQAMLYVVVRYASCWKYSLNADKSIVMVIGESRSLAQPGNGHLVWSLLKNWTSTTT